MTKEQIDQASLRAAESMVNICVSQAGLLLSALERRLVLIQAQHTFLSGLELGLRQQFINLKGGETKNESQ